MYSLIIRGNDMPKSELSAKIPSSGEGRGGGLNPCPLTIYCLLTPSLTQVDGACPVIIKIHRWAPRWTFLDNLTEVRCASHWFPTEKAVRQDCNHMKTLIIGKQSEAHGKCTADVFLLRSNHQGMYIVQFIEVLLYLLDTSCACRVPWN